MVSSWANAGVESNAKTAAKKQPVMAGLDPAIHRASGTVDGRLKGGHDN
jgi:hypothetical protein